MFERSTGDLASRGVGIGTRVKMFDIMRQLGVTVAEAIGQSFSSRFCLTRYGAVIARLPFDKILTSWTLLYRALRRQLPDACYRAGMQLDDIAQGDRCITQCSPTTAPRRMHTVSSDQQIAGRARLPGRGGRRLMPAMSAGAVLSTPCARSNPAAADPV